MRNTSVSRSRQPDQLCSTKRLLSALVYVISSASVNRKTHALEESSFFQASRLWRVLSYLVWLNTNPPVRPTVSEKNTKPFLQHRTSEALRDASTPICDSQKDSAVKTQNLSRAGLATTAMFKRTPYFVFAAHMYVLTSTPSYKSACLAKHTGRKTPEKLWSMACVPNQWHICIVSDKYVLT